MNPTRVRSAEERRAEIQARAAALGIDDAYISTLVDEFYMRIRGDARIGPVFEAAIGDQWESHLAKMKDFWASVALNAGRYSGKPVPAHAKHKQIERAHFDIWLNHFHETLNDTAPSPGAARYFAERAERIADSLKFAIFFNPASADATP